MHYFDKFKHKYLSTKYGWFIRKKFTSLITKNLKFHYTYSLIFRNSTTVKKNSDIVIEGFVRSSNTYFETNFRLSNPSLKIAHHNHQISQLYFANKFNKKIVFLIREPIDSIISAYIYWAKSTHPNKILNEWIKYHRNVINLNLNINVYSFLQVTTDYNSIITDLNKKTNSNFLLADEDILQKKTFNKIKENLKDIKRGITHIASIPSNDRNIEKQKIENQILKDSKSLALLKEANEIYVKLIDKD